MKLSVIALDYDGTIAKDGCADPSVLGAIDAARATHSWWFLTNCQEKISE
jgi:ribonucleotide monophosphatase NagD (HAD superfamily)